MKTQVDHLHTSALDVREEIRILWRVQPVPGGVDLDAMYQGFRRKCETSLGIGPGWVRPQDRPDIASEAICHCLNTLCDLNVPLDEAEEELRKALNRYRARAWRRSRRERNIVPFEEYEAAVHLYLETETEQAHHSQATEELMREVLELLRKAWPYFQIALDQLSVRDKTLFHDVYHLGQELETPADLSGLTRNARNVALYRARSRFLKRCQNVFSDALRHGTEEDRPLLRELLAMIETNRLKDLLAFNSRR